MATAGVVVQLLPDGPTYLPTHGRALKDFWIATLLEHHLYASYSTRRWPSHGFSTLPGHWTRQTDSGGKTFTPMFGLPPSVDAWPATARLLILLISHSSPGPWILLISPGPGRCVSCNVPTIATQLVASHHGTFTFLEAPGLIHLSGTGSQGNLV